MSGVARERDGVRIALELLGSGSSDHSVDEKCSNWIQNAIDYFD